MLYSSNSNGLVGGSAATNNNNNMVLSVHSFFPSVGLRMLGGGGNLGDPAIATDEGGEIGTGGGGGSAEETAKLLPQQPQPTSGGWGWPSFGGMMGNNTSPSQREGMRLLYQYFRLVIFLLHAATSVFFLVAAFTTNCGPSLVTASYFESVAILDGAWGGYNFDSHAGPSLPSMATLAMGASGLPSATLPAGPDPPVYNVEFLNANGSLYQSACVYPMLAGNNYASWSGVQYYSENRSWYICRALNPGPPYIMDVQEDVRSFIVGSAWNVLVLVLIFEWITSSYALLYLQEPAVLLQYLPVPPGFHPVPTLATVWNLAMIVILWAWRDTLLLPDNNLLLYSVLLLTTVVLQNYLARPGVPPLLAVGGAVVEEEDAAEEGRGAAVKEGFRASGHKTRSLMRTDALASSSSSSSSTYPLYQRKGKGGNNSSMRQLKGLGGGAHEFNTAAFLGGLTSGAVSSSTALTANETTGGKQAPLPAYVRWPVFYGSPSAGAVHSPVYAYNLDEGGEAVAARMMEYSTTAPLLLVGLTLCYMGAALTWAYQVLFLALMMCNALGIVLHYVVLLLRTAADEADRARLRDAGLLLLLASWLSFAAGFAIYLNEAADFMIHGTDMSGVPVWVVMLTWSLTIMYAAFGVVVTWFYLPRLMYPDPASWTATKAGDGAKDPWMRSFDWVVFSLDILSVAAKLALAWTIYTKGSVVNCAAAAAGGGGGTC